MPKITIMIMKEIEVAGEDLDSVERAVRREEDDTDGKVLTVFLESGMALESRQIFTPDGNEKVQMRWKWAPVTLDGGFEFVKRMMN